jgi:hypothetical protein
MVSSQTLQFRGSPSFFSLFFLLHCQGNGLSSALRESRWEMLSWDPALPTQQMALPAGHIAKVGGSVCPMHTLPPPWLGAHGEQAGQATLNCNMLSLLLP